MPINSVLCWHQVNSINTVDSTAYCLLKRQYKSNKLFHHHLMIHRIKQSKLQTMHRYSNDVKSSSYMMNNIHLIYVRYYRRNAPAYICCSTTGRPSIRLRSLFSGTHHHMMSTFMMSTLLYAIQQMAIRKVF